MKIEFYNVFECKNGIGKIGGIGKMACKRRLCSENEHISVTRVGMSNVNG